MNSTRKPDLLSYEIQAQALRQQAIAELWFAATRALKRAAGAVPGIAKAKPAAPATLPL